MPKKLIGLTGPSSFTEHCIGLIEERLNCDMVLLYHNDMSNIESWVPKCDGLILAGGVDIHPSLYGRPVHNNRGLTKFDFQRDVRELLVLELAFAHRKPTLGICRGHQMMAVYKGLGQDFVMDLDGTVCHQPSRANITVGKETLHGVELAMDFEPAKERAIIQRVLKQDKKAAAKEGFVNSFHHQGVLFHRGTKVAPSKYPKLKINVFAVAPGGDEDYPEIIEGMMGTDDESHWLSVQWHPEYDHKENSLSSKVIDMFEKKLG
jgi:gamma-glutamyl-gamma-aminobutyrate hydrolase PuuD